MIVAVASVGTTTDRLSPVIGRNINCSVDHPFAFEGENGDRTWARHFQWLRTADFCLLPANNIDNQVIDGVLHLHRAAFHNDLGAVSTDSHAELRSFHHSRCKGRLDRKMLYVALLDVSDEDARCLYDAGDPARTFVQDDLGARVEVDGLSASG
jgi:hypothetical protein